VHHSPLYTPTVLTLLRGSTLVLYTDGLVEAPWRPLAEGMAQLPHSVPPMPVGLETLADTVLTSMLGGDSSDDVALLAVRLT
jgi:serine phosphatase RsbU (regulator of sigma subunit)